MVPPEEMTNDNPAWSEEVKERIDELEYLNKEEFTAEVLYLIGVPYPYNKVLTPYLNSENREIAIRTITKESTRKLGGSNG